MAAGWIAASTAVNVGMSLWGGNKAANAAAEQAEAQNKAAHARYQYDLNMWDMKKQQLQAERMEATERIMASARNEGKIKAYKDVANEEAYDYNVKIRNAQQAGSEAAFKRSEDIYYDTTSLNSLAAKSSMDADIVKLQESRDEQAFDRNDAYLETLIAEGRSRARVTSGRSAVKGEQVTWADYGRQMEMLNQSLVSETGNTRAALEEIKRDKTSANLVAYANKMLDPGVLPMPLIPDPLPIAEYSLPRAWEEFDFGPKPVHGAMSDPNAAYNMQMANTYTGIASSFGSGLTSIAGAFR